MGEIMTDQTGIWTQVPWISRQVFYQMSNLAPAWAGLTVTQYSIKYSVNKSNFLRKSNAYNFNVQSIAFCLMFLVRYVLFFKVLGVHWSHF